MPDWFGNKYKNYKVDLFQTRIKIKELNFHIKKSLNMLHSADIQNVVFEIKILSAKVDQPRSIIMEVVLMNRGSIKSSLSVTKFCYYFIWCILISYDV